jgi:hypothetical protein
MTNLLSSVISAPVKNFAILALLLLLPGCINIGPFGKPTLRFTSTDRKHFLVQKYPEAYATQSEDGVYDVVLVATGLTSTEVDGAGSLLTPAYTVPVRQTIHMQIFWRPVRGAKPTSPAATNTVIHWYLESQNGSPDPGEHDSLRYDGTGFVLISTAEKHRAFKLKIVSATITPTLKEGNLQEPLGPAEISGYIKVKNDDERVKEILAELQQTDRTAAASR